jgi:RNase P subunit RPR2
MRVVKKQKLNGSDVRRLITEAIAASTLDLPLANTKLSQAWDACLRGNLKVPKLLRVIRCKKCGVLLMPARTASVRLIEGRAIWRCSSCGAEKHFRYA